MVSYARCLAFFSQRCWAFKNLDGVAIFNFLQKATASLTPRYTPGVVQKTQQTRRFYNFTLECMPQKPSKKLNEQKILQPASR
jgi:hypothetical protein